VDYPVANSGFRAIDQPLPPGSESLNLHPVTKPVFN